MSYRQQFMDRRRVVRHETGIEAEIRLPLRAPLACLVTNISRHGALIALGRIENLPSRIRIEIDGYELDASVIHRNRNFIGLEFATEFAAADHYAMVEDLAA